MKTFVTMTLMVNNVNDMEEQDVIASLQQAGVRNIYNE